MTTHRLPHLLSALLLLLVAVSCRKGDESALQAAESVMSERPDSALMLLEAIDGSQLAGELQARHALLLSQAYDKNYIDLTSDSLISIATAYYENGDLYRKMMSLFYRATIYRNSGDDGMAVMDATRAYEIARKLDDSYWIAKSADCLAASFYRTYNNKEGIHFRKIAVEHYAAIKDYTAVNWTLVDLASDYAMNNEYDRAINLIDSIMPKICNDSNDMEFKAHCMRLLFHFYVDTRNFELAKSYFDKLKETGYAPLHSVDYGSMGYAEAVIGNLDVAKSYIDSAYVLADSGDIQDILVAEMANWEYLKKVGGKSEIVEFTEKFMNTQNKITEMTVRQNAVGIQRDFYNGQALSAEHKISQVYFYVIVGLIVVVIVIVVVVIFVRLKMQLKNKEIELKISEVALLTSQIKERDAVTCEKEKDDCGKLRIVIDRLLSEWFRPINSLFDEYYENSDTSTAKNTMYARFEKELLKITSEKSVKDIENIVDDSTSGALTRLRNQIPEMNDKDITFVALNIAGLSPRAICLFLDIKIKTVYSKRKRVREKISNSNIEDKAFFEYHLK